MNPTLERICKDFITMDTSCILYILPVNKGYRFSISRTYVSHKQAVCRHENGIQISLCQDLQFFKLAGSTHFQDVQHLYLHLQWMELQEYLISLQLLVRVEEDRIRAYLLRLLLVDV